VWQGGTELSLTSPTDTYTHVYCTPLFRPSLIKKTHCPHRGGALHSSIHTALLEVVVAVDVLSLHDEGKARVSASQ
jgi:hypothetical protein